MHYVIGLGGGGTFLISILRNTVPGNQICLIDGDKVERKNLKRYKGLFSDNDVDKFKAEVLASKLGCKFHKRYITENDELEITNRDVVFICVDNQPARKNILALVDKGRAVAFMCANEYDSAQSYIYRSRWKGTADDPRVKFPEILTDERMDPLKPHCADEYQDNEQLATFNAISATFAMHLFYLWTEKKDVDDEIKTKMFSCNFNKYSQK